MKRRGRPPKPPAVTVASGEVVINATRRVFVRRVSDGDDAGGRILIAGGWTSGTGSASSSFVQLPTELLGELMRVLKAVGVPDA
jgi:hypothetical protein